MYRGASHGIKIPLPGLDKKRPPGKAHGQCRVSSSRAAHFAGSFSQTRAHGAQQSRKRPRESFSSEERAARAYASVQREKEGGQQQHAARAGGRGSLSAILQGPATSNPFSAVTASRKRRRGSSASQSTTVIHRDARQTTLDRRGKVRPSASQLVDPRAQPGTFIAEHLAPVPVATVFENPKYQVVKKKERTLARDAGVLEGYSHTDVDSSVCMRACLVLFIFSFPFRLSRDAWFTHWRVGLWGCVWSVAREAKHRYRSGCGRLAKAQGRKAAGGCMCGDFG